MYCCMSLTTPNTCVPKQFCVSTTYWRHTYCIHVFAHASQLCPGEPNRRKNVFEMSYVWVLNTWTSDAWNHSERSHARVYQAVIWVLGEWWQHYEKSGRVFYTVANVSSLHVHTCIHTCLNGSWTFCVRMCNHVHEYVNWQCVNYTYSRMCMSILWHECMHACTHRYTYAFTYIHTQTHASTHTHQDDIRTVLIRNIRWDGNILSLTYIPSDSKVAEWRANSTFRISPIFLQTTVGHMYMYMYMHAHMHAFLCWQMYAFMCFTFWTLFLDNCELLVESWQW
jgi:hypothetical protein